MCKLLLIWTIWGKDAHCSSQIKDYLEKGSIYLFVIRWRACWRAKICGYGRGAVFQGSYISLIYIYIYVIFFGRKLFQQYYWIPLLILITCNTMAFQRKGWDLGSQHCWKVCTVASVFPKSSYEGKRYLSSLLKMVVS